MTTITAVDVTGGATVGPSNEQPNTGEMPQAPQEAAVPKEEALSPKFAALARQQKALRNQQRALEAQKQSLLSERQQWDAIKADNEKYKSWQQRLSQDPYGVMLDAGLTADEVASKLLNQPDPRDQSVYKLQQELKSLRDSQDQINTNLQQEKNQQYENAVKQISNDVKMLVDSDSSFEMVKATNNQDAVVELIKEVYEKEDRLMTIEDASTMVEEFLIEEALKLASLSKVKSKLYPSQQRAETQKQQPQQQQQSRMNTLSNRMVQSTAKPTNANERRQRAIMAFEGTLK